MSFPQSINLIQTPKMKNAVSGSIPTYGAASKVRVDAAESKASPPPSATSNTLIWCCGAQRNRISHPFQSLKANPAPKNRAEPNLNNNWAAAQTIQIAEPCPILIRSNELLIDIVFRIQALLQCL